jgi:C1A family cysteine protease
MKSYFVIYLIIYLHFFSSLVNNLSHKHFDKSPKRKIENTLQILENSLSFLEHRYSKSIMSSRNNYSFKLTRWGFFSWIFRAIVAVVTFIVRIVVAIVSVIKTVAEKVAEGMQKAWDLFKNFLSELFGERRRNYEEAKNFIEETNKIANLNFKLKINKFAVLTKNEMNQVLSVKTPKKVNYTDFSSHVKDDAENDFLFNSDKTVEEPESPENKENNALFDQLQKDKICIKNRSRDIVARRSPFEPLDWVQKGYVTEVEDQKTCGCCWAFAASGMIESAYAIKNKIPVEKVSKQELINCVNDKIKAEAGCGGGHSFFALEYARLYRLKSDQELPYLNTQKTCALPKSSNSNYTSPQIESFNIYPEVTPEQMYKLLLKGPVAITIDASPKEFVFYSSGILRMHCKISSNHAVLLVGYGVNEMGIQFWKIKNSWGKEWGEDGYFRIENSINWNSCNIFKNVAEVNVAVDHKEAKIAKKINEEEG